MSTTVVTNATAQGTERRLRPSFWGLVRGEGLKMSRQWTTWILLVLLAAVIILPYIVELLRPNIIDQIHNQPLQFLSNALSLGLAVLRVFSGILLLILTVRMIGLEYQMGTIRVLLSRGVGRMQLLAAKLCAMAVVALIVLLGGLVLIALLIGLVLLLLSGNLNAFNSLTSQFWSDAWVYVLTILLNMGVTILLAAVATVIGRSVAFGLSISLIFFPLDNIGTSILTLVNRVTNNDFWLNITAYFLGPNLNAMASLLTGERLDSIGATPAAVPDLATRQIHGTVVDGTHTLVVAAIYAAVFLVVSFLIMHNRDVKE